MGRDQDGRSVQTLTLRALKTYENHSPTFQLFYAFSIILIREQKFSTAVSGEIREKRNSANAIILDSISRELSNAGLHAIIE